MLVAHIEDNFQLGVSEAPIPDLPENGAILKVLGCGLCGSDLDKVVQKKAPPGSVLGHEVVGIIEALNDEHPSGWKLGDRIVTSHHVPCRQCHYCRNDSESMCRQFKQSNLIPGGFSQYIALGAGHLQHTAFKVPDDISSAEASCVEPLACVLRAIRRGPHGHINGSVAVIGLGFIGMMAAQVYQNDGYTVYGMDLDATRLDLARQHSFVTEAFHPDQDTQRQQEVLKQQTPLGQVDIVFLTAVNEKAIDAALKLVRDGGTLIIFSSAPPGTSIDPSRLYFRELNLITSYSPGLQDLQDAANLIFRRKINLSPLLSHHMALADIQEAFNLYQTGQAIKVFIKLGDSQ